LTDNSQRLGVWNAMPFQAKSARLESVVLTLCYDVGRGALLRDHMEN
jgi:hypothetical protein